jgi:hybrid cluster-associated redox disulfide protein
MAVVTKDMIIGDILKINVKTAEILLKSGMHCLGCPSARSETLEQACAVHGADADKIVEEINGLLAGE